jgi:hypothetical protein
VQGTDWTNRSDPTPHSAHRHQLKPLPEEKPPPLLKQKNDDRWKTKGKEKQKPGAIPKPKQQSAKPKKNSNKQKRPDTKAKPQG